jgi:N-acetylneuraminic acid mutarotase
MKRVFIKVIIALLTICFFQACQSEKFTEKGIPEVQTVGVEILNDGVTFYGEILTDGGKQVSERGFSWAAGSNPLPEDIEYVLLGPAEGETQFSVTVNSTISRDVIYTMRAFIKTNELTSYGNEVTFAGMGSKPPELISVTPGSGPIGDTVIIKGNYFSNNPTSCSVYFDNNEATVTASAIDGLSVIIPYTPANTVKIRVAIAGILSSTTLDFNVLKPVPLEISPLSGTFGDIITLSGTNFPTDTSFFDVFFNNTKAQLTEVSETSFKVKVPTGNNVSPATLTVKYYDDYVFTDKFTLAQAVVDDVSPAEISSWQQIVITGSNFNPDAKMNQVEIGGRKTSIINCSANEIRVDLPYGLTSGSHKVVVTTIAGLPVTWSGYLILTTAWIKLIDFPSGGRVAAAGFSLGGKIYFGTGYELDLQATNDFWVYDPGTEQWTGRTNFPKEITYATGLSTNDMGYFAIGKLSGSLYNSLIRYDPVSNSWQSMASKPGDGSTMDSPGFVINGKLYIPAAGEMYEYNISTNTWTKKSYPAELGYFGGGAAFTINGKGYLGVGWVHEKSANVSDFFEYDPVTDTWSRRASFPGTLRDNPTSFSLANGKGYVGMGYSYAQSAYLNDVWEYDPVPDTWTRITDFPGSPRFGARAYVVGSDAYIIGGGHGGIYEKDMWRFTPPGK